MRIAVEGCCHGALDEIYGAIAEAERTNNFKVDLLLICGDFQALRNEADLETKACPPKYRHLGYFHEYYTGKKKAPVLTIFIGGNHEASSYLMELYYGGWVCENIYYLGAAGSVKVGGLRIAGVSGLQNDRSFSQGRHERLPYGQDTLRSVYYYRNIEVFKLKQLRGPVDIFISHEWPNGIHIFGDVGSLLRKKPFWRDEIERNQLGSTVCQGILHHLKPAFWFAGHMHIKFSAVVQHRGADGTEQGTTRFLALDKCLPNREFIQYLEIPHSAPVELQYDEEWLAITRIMQPFLSNNCVRCRLPHEIDHSRKSWSPTAEEISWVRRKLDAQPTGFAVPKNFQITAPPHPLTPQQRQELLS